MDITKEVFQNLKRMQMFANLTDDDISTFIGKIIVKRFLKSQTVLFEDETNSYMYILLSGRVKVVQVLEDGKESIRAIHNTGESFGELSLLDCKTSPALVVAMEDTTAAIIGKENFFSIVYNQRKVLDNLLKMFCFRLRDSWERVQMTSFMNASQRVIMVLQQQACEQGEKIREGVLLRDRFTHQMLGDMVGLNRETVTRVIDKLQKDGAITVRKDKKIILHTTFLKLIPAV